MQVMICNGYRLCKKDNFWNSCLLWEIGNWNNLRHSNSQVGFENLSNCAHENQTGPWMLGRVYLVLTQIVFKMVSLTRNYFDLHLCLCFCPFSFHHTAEFHHLQSWAPLFWQCQSYVLNGWTSQCHFTT